jgi:hypothetical protein
MGRSSYVFKGGNPFPRQPLTILECAKLYLERCDPAISGEHGHDTTFRIACALVQGFCLDPEQAYQLLASNYNTRLEERWSETELRHKIADACAEPTSKPRGYLLGIGISVPSPVKAPNFPAPRPAIKATYDPEYLQRFTAQLTDIVDSHYLESRREFTCHNRSPAGFLHKIFRVGEHVWVTDNIKSGEGVVWTHDGPAQDLSELSYLQADREGVWFLSNPIDGFLHEIERLKKPRNPDGTSFRAAECITNWRHLVLETDDAPEDLWLKALVLLDLPILAIYHSGGRGAHALINLGASSQAEWHALLAPHLEHLIKLGACPDTLAPVRTTRLPNCVRGQTGKLQQLLYLTPGAGGKPIAEHAVREDSLAVQARYLEATRFGPSDID